MTAFADRMAERAGRPSLVAQMMRFALVGTIGFVVDAALVALLSTWIGPGWAQLCAFPAAVTTTWALNRRYTFRSGPRPLAAELALYAGANSLGWIANNGVYFGLILSAPFFYRHAVVAVAAGALAGMVFNFVMSKWIVFR